MKENPLGHNIYNNFLFEKREEKKRNDKNRRLYSPHTHTRTNTIHGFIVNTLVLLHIPLTPHQTGFLFLRPSGNNRPAFGDTTLRHIGRSTRNSLRTRADAAAAASTRTRLRHIAGTPSNPATGC